MRPVRFARAEIFLVDERQIPGHPLGVQPYPRTGADGDRFGRIGPGVPALNRGRKAKPREMVRRAPPPLPQSYGMAERFLRIDRQTIEPQAARIVAVPRDAAEPAQCPLRVSPMPPQATADVDREQAAVANDRTAPAADDPVAVSIELQGSCRAVDHTQEHTEVGALELAEGA